MRKSGIAFMCPVGDKSCVLMRDDTQIHLTIDKRGVVDVLPNWRGFAGKPETFAIDILVSLPSDRRPCEAIGDRGALSHMRRQPQRQRDVGDDERQHADEDR